MRPKEAISLILVGAILITILAISLKHSNDHKEKEQQRQENQTTKIYDDYGK